MRLNVKAIATDSSQYEVVKELLEENNSSNPMFIFDVTVQNHGGYTGEIEQLKKEISLEGKNYEETGNYHCFHCGEDFKASDLSVCSECTKLMKNKESCICDACFEIKMAKD